MSAAGNDAATFDGGVLVASGAGAEAATVGGGCVLVASGAGGEAAAFGGGGVLVKSGAGAGETAWFSAGDKVLVPSPVSAEELATPAGAGDTVVASGTTGDPASATGNDAPLVASGPAGSVKGADGALVAAGSGAGKTGKVSDGEMLATSGRTEDEVATLSDGCGVLVVPGAGACEIVKFSAGGDADALAGLSVFV